MVSRSTTVKKRPTKKRPAKNQATRNGATTKKAPKRKPAKRKTKDVTSQSEEDIEQASEVIYPKFDVFVYRQDYPNGVMTMEEAKRIVGWRVVEDKKADFLFKDPDGNRIWCDNNNTNKPFIKQLTQDWKLEIARKKWQFNGESMIIDRLGKCQDCQHRLIGLIIACLEWQAGKWRQFWKEEPWIECYIAVGISEKDEVVNTIGVGKPRTLGDVLYRSEYFRDLPIKVRKKVSTITGHAVKMLWHRTLYDTDTNVFAPRRPHSESLAFIEKHPRLLECVRHIMEEEGGKDKRISGMIPMGYASALLYLQASARTDWDEYIDNYESAIDWGLWEKACEFWVELANGAKSLALLRAALRSNDRTDSFGLDCLCATLIKGWNLYSDEEAITAEGLELDVDEGNDEEDDVSVLLETPLIGGIDRGGLEALPDPDDAE
jgi:hypothetical protein